MCTRSYRTLVAISWTIRALTILCTLYRDISHDDSILFILKELIAFRRILDLIPIIRYTWRLLSVNTRGEEMMPRDNGMLSSFKGNRRRKKELNNRITFICFLTLW